MKKLITLVFIVSLTQLNAQKKGDSYFLDNTSWSGLSFRNVGPALTAGRVADIAVNPENPSEYYVAVASGGVFKTTNAGNTYKPVFDGEGAYSIGCITIDPSQNSTIWVGTGENNNQRSVAYGDGVYKSTDGGKSWKNMGLKSSEHIGKIIVHPENSDIVWVAAYGPLWSEGGERGVYMTRDGGETWELQLEIDEHTGISDLAIDPENPAILYAAAHQRRRHVFTYIGGGPSSAIYKSVDGGTTWSKLEGGLPNGQMGRIGIAVSPVDANVVYAIIEAQDDQQGFYKSSNKGATWNKQSDYKTSGNYYQEIICDPKDVDKVFAMDTWLHHTENGGKKFVKTGEDNKHVDNHTIWIDPNNTDHWIVGCDGGIYETWDHAKNWDFKENLPITQFYKVAVDNEAPFYYIYGGTQDNNSIGGPSQTINNAGILNSDWFITNGGDGFETQVDPKNPNIVYSQAQYGWLVRFDKQSGERIGIQPQPGKDEPAYRWNWDAPLLISPHDNKTLYFCANKVFKSTDRGNTWTTISPDLTRQEDRNKFKVMDKVWGINTIMKNKSTTIYGNIVAFDESPQQKGLLYAGTDDGLIQVSQDDGATWTQHSTFDGIPEKTYVNMIVASQHDANTVYAVFNNHKRGDFKPYIKKSTNKGKTWVSIQGDLPERGSVYAFAQDEENPNLLFAGTEFGFFFTVDGGQHWHQIKSGIPTIAVRDIAIQRRENDIVLASFGRGFYVLDDYTPLRSLTEEAIEKEAHIFPIEDALLYVQSNPLGLRGKGSQGSGLYTAPNPDFGATFTYYIKEAPKTLKKQRRGKEKELDKEGKDVFYPSEERLRAEDQENKPKLIFHIEDHKGNSIQKLTASYGDGINRITWNLRYPTTTPITLRDKKTGRYSIPDEGPLVLPGDYQVSLYESVNDTIRQLVAPVPFKVEKLNNTTLPSEAPESMLAFKEELSEFRRLMRGSSNMKSEYEKRLKHLKKAVEEYPNASFDHMKTIDSLEHINYAIDLKLWGDQTLSKFEFETVPSIGGRVETIVYQTWNSTADPTHTQQESLAIAKEEFTTVRKQIDEYVKAIKQLEEELSDIPIPYTPGRDENWKNYGK